MSAALDRDCWDLIIADQSLPQFSALEALKLVKSKPSYQETPFVIVSGRISFDTALDAMRSGADDYVMKSNLERLVPVVERCLRHGEVRAERKKAEAARLESEARFSALAESIPAIIFVHQQSRFCYVNSAAERILGYSRTELLKMNFWEVVRPDFRDLVRSQGLRREMGEALASRSEFPIISKNGEERWLECTAGRIDFGGQPAVTGSAFDITDRKHAEKRSNAFSRLGQELGATSTARQAAQTIVAIAGELLGWDACYLHLFSAAGDMIPVLTFDTIKGERVEVSPSSFSLEPSAFMRGVRDQGARLLNRKNPEDGPGGLTPFGDTNRLSASMLFVPVRSEDEVIGILSIQSYTPGAYDQQALSTLQALADHCGSALERIQVGMTLRQSEERFRQVVENIGEVFWMTDIAKEAIIYVSPAYELIWGRSCQSVYASPRDWLEAIVPQDRERVRLAALTRQVSGEYQEEYRIVRPDGTMRWIADRAFPIRDQAGRVYRIAGVARDITERKALTTEILRIAEHEQQRFGQDVHDGLCQHLVALKYKITFVEKQLAAETSSQAGQVKKIRQLVTKSLQEAYDLAKGLYPVKVEAEGLRCALQELALETESRFDVICKFRFRNNVVLEDNNVGIHMYRIAQEAVSNAIKHGKATRLLISLILRNGLPHQGGVRPSSGAAISEETDSAGKRLDRDPGEAAGSEEARTPPHINEGRPSQTIILTIKDNGLGHSAASGRGNRMGLRIMNYRAGAIGASFQLQWRTHGGARASCVLPVHSRQNITNKE